MNGSRRGKEFSVNVFNDLYEGKQEQAQEPHLSNVYNIQPATQQNNSYTLDESVTGGIFSILAPEPRNQSKEGMPLRRRKKKKKRRYGRQM